jgi:predicted dehydrogenase
MSEPKKLRAAVAGTAWGAVHARAIAQSPHAELCAIWSRSDNEKNRAIADRYRVPLFTDYQKMLDTRHPQIVTVATPERQHGSMTIAALDCGAHVYCEKVIADNRETGAAMVARSHENKRLLNIGYCYRYSPSLLYLSNVIHRGQLGPLLFAQLRAFTWCLHHMTDYVSSLLGQPRRVVGAFEREPLAERPHISPPQLAFPTFTYAAYTRKAYMVEYANGAILMAAGTDYSSLEEPGATLLIQGAEGWAEVDDLAGNVTLHRGIREMTGYKPSQICDPIGLQENCIAAVLDFVRAVAEEKSAPIPGEQGLAMLKLEETITLAAKTNQWVTL